MSGHMSGHMSGQVSYKVRQHYPLDCSVDRDVDVRPVAPWDHVVRQTVVVPAVNLSPQDDVLGVAESLAGDLVYSVLPTGIFVDGRGRRDLVSAVSRA